MISPSCCIDPLSAPAITDMFMQQPRHHARSTQLNCGQIHLLSNRYEEIMRGGKSDALNPQVGN